MFNKNKHWIWLLISLFSLPIILGLSVVNVVNADAFLDRIKETWLNIDSLLSSNSISRYEVARLLNMVWCEDCINASNEMREHYTKERWNDLIVVSWKNFNDIDYQWAVEYGKSYYYCVAYVWDHDYMDWYPLTSNSCQWNFCWQKDITPGELYQTVLNIIQGQIRWKYAVDWKAVKSWYKSLGKDSYAMQVLNATDKLAIEKATTGSNVAQTNDEFQAWLKYCMFNLSWCNFQAFWKIWHAYWPVSELNVLYKEKIITEEDAIKVASQDYVKWDDALRIFGTVYDNFSTCSFDVDYDCDWIVNSLDNCPYSYNANQYDLDGDWIWNVCDDDIDGDWKNNPIGIVDDNNNIVISLWDDKSDQDPLKSSESLWFWFFINVESISSSSPTTVKFKPLTDGKVESIKWDFWDGDRLTSDAKWVSHVFEKPWTYIVKAVANPGQTWSAFAMTKVFIAVSESDKYTLNITPKYSLHNWNVEYTFTPSYIGNVDYITWSIDWNKVANQKPTYDFKYSFSWDSSYVIWAQAYRDGEVKAASLLTVYWDWSRIHADVTPWDLWADTTVEIKGVTKTDIQNISINWWWYITSSTWLKQSYAYEEAGVHMIQVNVQLKNWKVFNIVSTVTIQNPLLQKSYAINLSWKRLSYGQNENLALGLNLFPIMSNPVLSLLTSYQAWHKNYVSNPVLSNFLLNYAYTTAWDVILTNFVEINKCVALTNQWTLYIDSADQCELALKNNDLWKFKCDLDKDWIPDICDDDIDWDWVKNLLWLIKFENEDCSFSTSEYSTADWWGSSKNGWNIDLDVLRKSLGVCSLDNCPFTSNSSQTDLNNNWVWEVCEDVIFGMFGNGWSDNNDWWDWDTGSIASTLDGDSDRDGVLDSIDKCPDVPWNWADGCPVYYSQNCRVFSSCWDWKIDEWETCLTCPQDAWSCCWNGKLEFWESCASCPKDAWDCSKCWDWKIDEWEDCRNCPQDVWECSAFCWNGVVDEWETCLNCPEDLKTCSAHCWNEDAELWETCLNCPEDVKMCRSKTCWDKRVDEEAWEQCDNWDDNWKDWICTLSCTKYNPNRPLCWNGVIDEWEDCEICPVDLGSRCIDNDESKCWDWKIDEWETCLSCPQDVWECSAKCWDWEIGEAETCLNCPEDVGPCPDNFCWDWKISKWETCLTCPQDVWECSAKCWDWEIGEAETCLNCPEDVGPCPDGFCWDGVIEKWENCKTCSIDVWECNAFCWNGIVEDAETCLNCSKDLKACSAHCWNGDPELWETCENCPQDVWKCRSETCWDNRVDKEAWEECDHWDKNWKDNECTLSCTKYNPDMPKCWNWVIDEWEDCDTCPVDLWKRCVDDLEENKCWNGKFDEWETCLNCPIDLWKCTAHCWDGIIQNWETCDNCPKDVKVCRSKLCWNNKVNEDAWEECDDWEKNWTNKKCTLSCTKYDSEYPDCWNWVIDEWEDCKTCPVDFWEICMDDWSKKNCWNGKIDEWETCKTCPQDVWECSAYCWDWEIGEWETCLSCPQDVKACSAYCWNGIPELWETCLNCPEDVKECRDETCWNKKLEPLAWEQCDNWKEKNWTDKKCTLSCTKYNSDMPNCWNGKIEKWEDCETCPVDLWKRCVDNMEEDRCWNGKIDEWETCKTCPKDVWECNGFCWNKTIEDAETCLNCREDLNKCSAHCGNNKIELWETCENCPQDVWKCRSETCWDGEVNEEAGEQCDHWKKNWTDNECTASCTLYDSKYPKCWNGVIDEWEDCETCPVDLWKRCIENADEKICWNGKIDEWEQCDPKDPNKLKWWEDGCSNSCEKIDKSSPACNAEFDTMSFINLTNNILLCSKWSVTWFSYNPSDLIWYWYCANNTKRVNCSAIKSQCWDWIIWEWEDCNTCAKDLKDICLTDWSHGDDKCWDGNKDDWETCYTCSEDVKGCEKCWNGKIDEWEDCQTCPKDLKGICLDDWDHDEEKCWNGKIDEWEDCQTCPKDLKDICLDDWYKPWDTCWNGEHDWWETCEDCPYEAWDCHECWDWRIDEWEDCQTCSKDLKDICLDDWHKDDEKCWDWKINEWETCKTCPKDLKYKCVDDWNNDKCWNWVVDEWETCKNCPKDLKDKCVTSWEWVLCWNNVINPWEECDDWTGNWVNGICTLSCTLVEKQGWSTCWNGKVDEWETCDNCPADLGWCIENKKCNSCPCEYADIASALTQWDYVRARLWDKIQSVFYKNSNAELVNKFITF